MRVDDITAPAGPRQWHKEYWPSGDLRERTKPSLAMESFFYNTNGEISHQNRLKPDGSGLAKQQPYTYDQNGNRKTDERGLHEYNARDQLVRWVRGPGEFVDYVLTGNGSVLRKTDSVGPDTTYQYVADRLAFEFHTGEPDQEDNYSKRYHYDDYGAVTAIDKGPVNATASEYAAEITYAYDSFSRLTQERSAGDPNSGVRYAYDALDRRDASQRQPARGRQRALIYRDD
jgi:hypothetical protein